ncbi:MAG: hypothetical protein ACNA71_05830 [Kiritimatiellia bacterium]
MCHAQLDDDLDSGDGFAQVLQTFGRVLFIDDRPFVTDARKAHAAAIKNIESATETPVLIRPKDSI